MLQVREVVAADDAAIGLCKATRADVPGLLALINDYAKRGQLLPRTAESLEARLGDFSVIVGRPAPGASPVAGPVGAPSQTELLRPHPPGLGGSVIGCAALTPLGPGVGEVRSLAVAPAASGRGLGRALVIALLQEAAARGFTEVLALTRRVSFFDALGFRATRREHYLDKLMVDCAACPKNLCCDETAMVRPPAAADEFV